MKARKFLVISYDNDEQQTFWDHVLAANADKAKAFVETHRPYAIAVDCLNAGEMREVAKNLAGADRLDIGEKMRDTVREFKEAGQ